MMRTVAVPEEKSSRTETPQERSFEEAIERVYGKYGFDLSQFFRDVEEEIGLKKECSSNLHSSVEPVFARTER